LERFGIAPKKFECRIIVDKSWWYPKENEDSKDVNKIFGKSIGWHVMDSVRLGWVPDFENKWVIKLYWYTTVNFVDAKDSLWICDLLPLDEIVFRADGNKFQVDYPLNSYDDLVKLPFISDSLISWFSLKDIQTQTYTHPKNLPGYWLNPYIGGQNKAEHDTIFKSEITKL